ncbi:hypothetical protein GOM49_02500 [Clostridium bovifaecis]|uniref:Competence protein ComF n=1 Tax=Clostridium bovifaecis TaxID=2184719 RepID=A0A6I6EYT8_9CLOT|nr:hypothetical protein GOM49_02500 [Clostridium bovifaecis]
MYSKNINPSSIEKRLRREIAEWALGKEKFLNITSPPYNLVQIFSDVILRNINSHRKVLYITNEDSSNVHIINHMKKEYDFKGYTYYKENSQYENSPFIISKHNTLHDIKDKFDLVIYDDIKSFSFHTKQEVAEASINMCRKDGKIISYSIEKIFDHSREIILPVRGNCSPLVEPKFISTRIDINKDIPYVAYEYIEWSINSDRKVIVYVPDATKVQNVHEYLSKYCSKFSRGTLPFIKNKSEKRVLYNFVKMKKGIVITDHFNDVHFDLRNINVMVFFADNKYFDYKKLVYLCGKVGRNESNHNGEVVFLGNYETEDMDKAKSITRHFNKEAWDMNLLRI